MTPERRFEWGGLSAGRADYVSAPEALAVVEAVADENADLAPQTGTRDGQAFVAFSRGDRSAVASTPGSRWFTVEVDTGHRSRLVDATSTRAEAIALTALYARAAAAYVREGTAPVGAAFTIEVEGRTLALTKPLSSRFRAIFARGD